MIEKLNDLYKEAYDLIKIYSVIDEPVTDSVQGAGEEFDES